MKTNIKKNAGFTAIGGLIAIAAVMILNYKADIPSQDIQSTSYMFRCNASQLELVKIEVSVCMKEYNNKPWCFNQAKVSQCDKLSQ